VPEPASAVQPGAPFPLPQNFPRPPTRVSLRSVNFPDRFLRHKFDLAELDQISSDLDKADATFTVTVGINGPQPSIVGGAAFFDDRVSFASVNKPGFWLRHQDFRLKLAPEPVRVDEFGVPRPLPPDTPELKQFLNDATFHVEHADILNAPPAILFYRPPAFSISYRSVLQLCHQQFSGSGSGFRSPP
jgi:hypothetical protein